MTTTESFRDRIRREQNEQRIACGLPPVTPDLISERRARAAERNRQWKASPEGKKHMALYHRIRAELPPLT